MREKAGLRREELAVLTGLSYQTIVNIEHGKAEPKVRSLRRIAEALAPRLGTTPNKLLITLLSEEPNE